MDGKFNLSCVGCGGLTTEEMRYGGWTALKRPADGVWVKDYYFYVSQSSPGTYTLSNIAVSFIKGYNAGSYSMGTLFDGIAGGDGSAGFYGTVDIYTSSSGYGFTSSQLSIQWCDSGTC